ncbi:MAG TPA: DsbA family protein [Kofleriaceae bacterium]|jgi:2-hydroxychromene-2-carboxylate isomerase
MIIAKRLKGKAIATWLGPTGDAARRALTRARQRITQAPRRLDFYFEIADPMSYLTAQAVARLVAAYPVELGVHVVTPPASDVDPAPTLRPRHAVRDAHLLAEYWNLEFPGKREADSNLVRDVGTALIRDRPAAEQLRAVTELASAMWRGDKKELGTLLLRHGTESSGSVAPILNANYAELRKAGHYQGAMLSYDGTWYGGIDRLPYLEAALAADLGVTAAPVVVPRPEAERGPLKLSEQPLACELWFSFRSPYSYLALEQIEGVLAPYGVPLVLRPVPPMVTRGLEVPAVKRAYFVRDAKREADRLGIAFGELCDPLGPGIDNCLTLAHHAAQRGKLVAFARSALRGIWAEALDVAEYVDLRQIVERAGLSWDEAHAVLRDPAATAAALKAAQAHAADLAVYGLWGVPSMRCGELITWGQDRLPLLADRLRRHALATRSQ